MGGRADCFVVKASNRWTCGVEKLSSYFKKMSVICHLVKIPGAIFDENA